MIGGNSRADEVATLGTIKHQETEKDLRDYEEDEKLILEAQRYLLRRQGVLVNTSHEG